MNVLEYIKFLMIFNQDTMLPCKILNDSRVYNELFMLMIASTFWTLSCKTLDSTSGF